jgi:hypothetical protein
MNIKMMERAPTTIKRLTVFIGWTGHVTFNSEASHPTGPFASNSSIYAEHFVTDTGSLFEDVHTPSIGHCKCSYFNF